MKRVLQNIKLAVAQKKLDFSDLAVARFISDTVPEAGELCLWLGTLANQQLRAGNVCLDYATIPLRLQELGVDDLVSMQNLQQALEASPAVGVDDAALPLIACADKLYFHRQFHNEKAIAATLLALAEDSDELTRQQVDAIDQCFGPGTEIDYQKIAAIISCRHRLCIISGGPGTGKTWTVSRILSLLQQASGKLDIVLSAPTGKAAARLSESLRASQAEQGRGSDLLDAVTLHRLLGIHRFTHRPRYNRFNRLQCDVLVVDEASMIDQQMMALLCDALPPHCRLILLGDKDQLSSVEAGSVFADICGDRQQTQFYPAQLQWLDEHWGLQLAEEQHGHRLADNVVVLVKSHRFDDRSLIGQLAKTINKGASDEALEILQTANTDSIVGWQVPPTSGLTPQLVDSAAALYAPLMQADSVTDAFKALHAFRVLSPVWDGPFGVDRINVAIEGALLERHQLPADSEFYAGKPLLMTSNLYQYDIYNGDIGILWPDESGQLMAWFEHGEDGLRALSLSQVGACKTAFAMTVHKSQGSEFSRVLVVLPSVDSPVLCREMLYTAVTRTKTALEVWGPQDIIVASIQRKTRRVSGLLQRLGAP